MHAERLSPALTAAALAAAFALFMTVFRPMTPSPAWQENFRRWSEMAPEEQARVQKNYEHWKSMPQAQRVEVERRYQTFRSLQPAKREMMRDSVRMRSERPYRPAPLRRP